MNPRILGAFAAGILGGLLLGYVCFAPGGTAPTSPLSVAEKQAEAPTPLDTAIPRLPPIPPEDRRENAREALAADPGGWSPEDPLGILV